MSRPFDKVVIVGIGLIGGSLAAALRGLPEAPHVTGTDPDASALRRALELGVIDTAVAPDAVDPAILDADLVVIATPAAAVIGWLERIGHLGYAGIVTDVASTKSEVVAAAERYLSPGACFVGGHPMAGSERSGVGASDPELFRGAYYVLTPADDTDAEAYRRLHQLVTSIGARAIAISADSHDQAVAAISHVPHIAASALTNLAAARAQGGDDVLRLAAGGFKDMTRIAAGSADLWTGICLDNRAAVIRALGELTEQLRGFARLLEADDRQGTHDWLARAADVRNALPARWVPKSERLHELAVPLTDRPGAVSAVTLAAARAGCNIENIGIDHITEDTAVLRLVLTDEGDVRGLVDRLREDGFEAAIVPLRPEGGGA